MRDDYQNQSPPQPPQPQPQDSSSTIPSQQASVKEEGQQQQGLRRRKEQTRGMGEGFYISVDESNGNESPKKRARTGSLSDHGSPLPPIFSYKRDLYVCVCVEMDTENIVQSPQDQPSTEPTSNSDVDMQNGDSSSASSSSSSSEIIIPSTPPGKEDQLKILKAAMLERLEIGATVYLLPTKWFDAFTNWAQGRGGGQPSRVDPLPVLCDQDGVILESAQESRDYHIITQDAWSLIQRWSIPPHPPTFCFESCVWC